MADPLSITTGLLAIIGGAVKTCQFISTLKDIRKLPEEFSSLFAEVADLSHVLEECSRLEASRSLDEADGEAVSGRKAAAGMIGLQVKRASQKLADLGKLLQDKTGHAGHTPTAEFRSFWNGLVNGKNRLNSARDELRDIRLSLSASLQLTTSSLVSSIGSALDSIVVSQGQISANQQELQNFIYAISEKAQAAALQPESPPPQYATNEHNWRRFSEPDTSSTAMTIKKPELGPRRHTADSVIPTIDDPLRNSCTAWCSCRCHTPSSIRAPGPFNNVFGSFSITHSGLPYLTRPCDQKKCRRRALPRMNFTYRLPRYWAERLFTMSIAISDLAGPEVRVRLPRVVDWTSPVWQYAIQKDTKAVQNLFRSGLASPWDVQALNGNLLHYATDHWNADLCRVLLDAGADPNAEDDFKNTPVSVAWEHVLSGRMSPNDSSVVASLFADSDYLSQRRFTTVHKIVLGLFSKDLDQELACSTSDIDTKDSSGRTPLSWAAARGDEESVSILLKHQADPRLADECGDTPLHFVRNTACAQLLVEAGADATAVNHEGATALHLACQTVRSASLVDFLIINGCDVNARDKVQLQTPLHIGLSNPPATPFIDILLDAGADINAHNSSHDTPLRFAVMYNAHRVIHRMLEPHFNANFAGYNAYGQGFSHALARTADVETLRILTEAKPPTLLPDTDTLDYNKKTSMDYLQDRLSHLDEADGLIEAFNILVDALKGVPLVDPVNEVMGKLEATLTLSVEEVIVPENGEAIEII